MTEQNKLLPCPFCGTDGVKLETGANYQYFIECRDCPAVMEDDDEAELRAAWNKRASQ